MTTSCALTEHEVLYDTLAHKLYLVLTPFIICIGLIGNIFTVCVFILTDLKRQPVSIVTIALAIADSFVLLIPVSIIWLEKLLRQELTDLSPFWCRTHGFFDLTFTSCSSWLMVFIAFERFCAVWLPHNNKKIFTHRKTFILVLIIVFLSTILSTWFIFVVKTIRIQNLSLKNHTDNILLTSDNRTIMQYWKCNLIDDSLYDSMGMFSVIINYILPFIFVLLLNSTVIYRLCQRGIVELTSSITVTLILVCLVHLFCTLPFQLLKILKTYITAVSQHRLHLFNQYTQSDEFYDDQNLLNVRRQILDRFEWVIIELEQIIENLQRRQLSVIDAQQSIERPLVKEVIETSLNADSSSIKNRKQFMPNKDEWQTYKRDLQETKEELHVLDLFIHRGISKIDRLVTSASSYT
ncbi:unnamed protein product [Rotaria sp. Silwood2]|nr:unnamed protein product [Rotaria sp. Silwood2]